MVILWKDVMVVELKVKLIKAYGNSILAYSVMNAKLNMEDLLIMSDNYGNCFSGEI